MKICSKIKALKCAGKIGKKIGSRKIIDDPDILEKYAHDESDETPHLPAAVVLPENAGDVSHILRLAEQDGVYITPRGGGTGKSGGAVPILGGIVLSMEKMKGIEEISRDDLISVVRPGTILKDFHNSVEENGLFYPPDPASLSNCSIGGNVVENAGGPRAFKYGTTSNYVISLEMVLMGGKVIKAGRRTVKQVGGPSLVSLMSGSEGTLSVITNIWLKLLPMPQTCSTLVISFSSIENAFRASNAVFREGILPRVMDFIDSTCMNLMREYAKIDIVPEGNSVLLVELDGQAGDVENQIDRISDVMEKHGANQVFLLSGAVEKSKFWEARRELSEYLKKKFSVKLSDDISLPRSKISNVIEKIYEYANNLQIVCAIFGHCGDGNLHVNLLGMSEHQKKQILLMRDRMMKVVLEVEGAVSGEHGIGSLKKKYLRWQQGRELLAMQKKLKLLFDPGGFLNPGKIY